MSQLTLNCQLLFLTLQELSAGNEPRFVSYIAVVKIQML